jgi:vitamin B12/bleomycin/antimicrobial peptide transport system ATP-binding/permease protein
VLSLRNVEVDLPDGSVLLRNVDLSIERGSTIAVQGPSGSGKTTLFRVIAGIWPFGRDVITLPRNARMLFLPQRPYLPLGALMEVLSYPDKPDKHDDHALADALVACRLPHLTGRLEENANWALALSPGEQQRVAFARALLFRPDWLFLDEANTALDEATEADLYRTLKQRLPGTTLISIAHDTRVAAFHDARILIDPRHGRATFAEVRAAE